MCTEGSSELPATTGSWVSSLQLAAWELRRHLPFLSLRAASGSGRGPREKIMSRVSEGDKSELLCRLKIENHPSTDTALEIC
jgi:hypothetical protein